MSASTLLIIQRTIQDVRYIVEPLASDPNKPTLFARIYDFLGAWNQPSRPHIIPAYNAWGKVDRPVLQ